jgi:sporulation protein YlmC with PRC-barrel domain
VTDDGHAISYKVLARGTPVSTADGVEIGRVRDVLESSREQIFDGLVVDTPEGVRWVDAPEVARIYERRVVLAIGAEEARQLPERDPKGGVSYVPNVKGGRLGRLWRRR